MGRAVGIDLGTTNSCVAMMTPSGPQVVRHRGGSTLIPSVYAIDRRGRELVGEDARKQASLNPENTVAGSKRFIGRNFHSDAVQAIREHFAYATTPDPMGNVAITIGGQVVSLAQVAARILTKIKESTQEAIEDFVTDVVITVPAYFNDQQRSAVREAGRIAGVNVLRILNEPTAAALAYGAGRAKDETLAVYDLGGGTFDISIIKVSDQLFEVIATGGDTLLGGLDFDRRVADILVNEFYRQHNIDLRSDPVAMARILEQAEGSKVALSAANNAPVSLPFIARGPAGPINLERTIQRAEFDQACQDLVQRTLMTVQAIVQAAGLTVDGIDQVLLVGGSTRIPAVQQALTSLFGRPPAKNVHPDEAVALGAAVMADLLSTGSSESVTLVDVLPQSIGLGLPDGRFHPIFAKFTPVPASKTISLTNATDNQESLEINLFQGESPRANRNAPIGHFQFRGLRPGAAGTVKVSVVLQLDAQGILSVTARDFESGQEMESRMLVPEGIAHGGNLQEGKHTQSPPDGSTPPAAPRPAPSAAHAAKSPTISAKIPGAKTETKKGFFARLFGIFSRK